MATFPLTRVIAGELIACVSKRLKKKIFGQPKSPAGRLAKTVSISFYPKHLAVLLARERELNMSRSVLLQIMMEMEEQKGLLREELIARLTNTNTGAPPIERNQCQEQPDWCGALPPPTKSC